MNQTIPVEIIRNKINMSFPRIFADFHNADEQSRLSLNRDNITL
ncbi:hypothetical protein [Phormidium nigroviride]